MTPNGTTRPVGAQDSRKPRPTDTGESLESFVRRRVQEALAEHPSRARPGYELAKRALDVSLALVGLLVVLPIIAVLAIIIRIESPGPGRLPSATGRPVRRGDTVLQVPHDVHRRQDPRFPDLYDYEFTEDQFATAYYKPSDDPRNTPVRQGAAQDDARRAPQPVQRAQGRREPGRSPSRAPGAGRATTRPSSCVKFSVKSGITGLAQVSGRNNLDDPAADRRRPRVRAAVARSSTTSA